MQKENDTLLVAKLREGNKFAFEALYEKYSARLYNTIVLLVYDKSLAKDITQSSFMTIWEKRSNLDTEKSFPAYLCTIARNMVYKETERRLLHNNRWHFSGRCSTAACSAGLSSALFSANSCKRKTRNSTKANPARCPHKQAACLFYRVASPPKLFEQIPCFCLTIPAGVCYYIFAD